MYKAEELARYVTKAKFRDLPGDVVDKAKECVIDSIGCAVGASQTEIGKILIDVAESMGGNPESTLIGSKNKVSAAVAAFANSELSNKLDYDDITPGHTGATVVPPAIAMAEKLGASGKDLVTAVVLGYELCCRVVASVREIWPMQQKRVWGLGTWGTFGATTVAGKLLNLNDEQMTHAITVAGCNAPVPSLSKSWGWGYPWDHIGRSTHVKNNYGTASWVGITSAILAQKGFHGPCDLFEGDVGFWRWMGGIGYDNDKLTAGLGEKYRIRGVNFKSYPSCGFIQPSIAAALGIIGKNNIRAEDIDAIKVNTIGVCYMPMFTNLDMKDMQDAFFSLPWSVAAAIVGIERSPNYYDESLKDPRVRQLAEKIQVIPDIEADLISVKPSEKSGLFPPIRATVELVAKGKKFTNQLDMYFGEAYSNYPDAKQKFTLLTSPAIGAEKTDKLFEALRNLENYENIQEVTELLR